MKTKNMLFEMLILLFLGAFSSEIKASSGEPLYKRMERTDEEILSLLKTNPTLCDLYAENINASIKAKNIPYSSIITRDNISWIIHKHNTWMTGKEVREKYGITHLYNGNRNKISGKIDMSSYELIDDSETYGVFDCEGKGAVVWIKQRCLNPEKEGIIDNDKAPDTKQAKADDCLTCAEGYTKIMVPKVYGPCLKHGGHNIVATIFNSTTSYQQSRSYPDAHVVKNGWAMANTGQKEYAVDETYWSGAQECHCQRPVIEWQEGCVRNDCLAQSIPQEREAVALTYCQKYPFRCEMIRAGLCLLSSITIDLILTSNNNGMYYGGNTYSYGNSGWTQTQTGGAVHNNGGGVVHNNPGTGGGAVFNKGRRK